MTLLLLSHLISASALGPVSIEQVHAERLKLLRQALALEDGIAAEAGQSHSPRTRLLSLEPRQSSYGFEFRIDGRQVATVFLRSLADSPRQTPVGIESFQTWEEVVDPEIASSIRADLFQERRNDFRRAYVGGLLKFSNDQGVIYDSYSVYFPNERPSGGDVGDGVVITGYLDSLPSFMLKSSITGEGLIHHLRLYPGVLVNEKHPINLTPADALALAKSRESQSFPLSWDNVIVEFAYADLRPNGPGRSTPGVPPRTWEAYPVCYVRPYKMLDQEYSWLETYVIDAVTKEILRVEPLSLWLGRHNAKKPQIINLHRDATAYQLFQATAPEEIVFDRPERFYMSLFGTVDGHISADGHYVQVPSGTYYSPIALPQVP